MSYKFIDKEELTKESIDMVEYYIKDNGIDLKMIHTRIGNYIYVKTKLIYIPWKEGFFNKGNNQIGVYIIEEYSQKNEVEEYYAVIRDYRVKNNMYDIEIMSVAPTLAELEKKTSEEAIRQYIKILQRKQ